MKIAARAITLSLIFVVTLLLEMPSGWAQQTDVKLQLGLRFSGIGFTGAVGTSRDADVGVLSRFLSKRIMVWNLQNGRRVRTIQIDDDGDKNCARVYVTPDGRTLVCQQPRAFVYIDASTGRTKKRVDFYYSANVLIMGADMRYALAQNYRWGSNKVRIYDFATDRWTPIPNSWFPDKESKAAKKNPVEGYPLPSGRFLVRNGRSLTVIDPRRRKIVQRLRLTSSSPFVAPASDTAAGSRDVFLKVSGRRVTLAREVAGKVRLYHRDIPVPLRSKGADVWDYDADYNEDVTLDGRFFIQAERRKAGEEFNTILRVFDMADGRKRLETTLPGKAFNYSLHPRQPVLFVSDQVTYGWSDTRLILSAFDLNQGTKAYGVSAPFGLDRAETELAQEGTHIKINNAKEREKAFWFDLRKGAIDLEKPRRSSEARKYSAKSSQKRFDKALRKGVTEPSQTSARGSLDDAWDSKKEKYKNLHLSQLYGEGAAKLAHAYGDYYATPRRWTYQYNRYGSSERGKEVILSHPMIFADEDDDLDLPMLGEGFLATSHKSGRIAIWDGKKGKYLRSIGKPCTASNVQRTLADIGFYRGRIDGVAGPGTKRAVVAFLESKDLQPGDELKVANPEMVCQAFGYFGHRYQDPELYVYGDRLLSMDRYAVLRSNPATGKIEQRVDFDAEDGAEDFELVPDGNRYLLYVGTKTHVYKISAEDLSILGKWKVFDFGLETIAVTNDGTRLTALSNSGEAKSLRTSDGSIIVTTVVAPNKEWVSVTPAGFFAGSERGGEMLNVTRGLEAYSVDQVYQALYRPDLVEANWSGDKKGEYRKAAAALDIDKLLDSGPAPRIELRETGRALQGEKIKMAAVITDEGGGVGRVEWRVNGLTLGVESERGFERVADQPKAAGGKSTKVTRELWLEPGENRIEVVAYNAKDLIASKPSKLSVTWEGQASTSAPRLHVLAIGVNDYWDSRLRLNHAVGDAKAVAAALRNAGKGLYESVSVTSLLDREANLAGLEAAFEKLGNEVRPRDVFLFFLAGHGKTVDGRYYFIPQDFRYSGEESIAEKGIGQDKWQRWFSRIPARKSLLLYDTCESGSLTGDRLLTRSMERIAALDKLTRAMGRTVLSAATDEAPALEGYRGHGVFTYALLDGLARSDNNKNALIEVTELAGYVDSRVPEISHEAFGFRQVPQMKIVGSNFPLAKPVAALQAPDGKSETAAAPAKPTHVVITALKLFAASGGEGDPVETLSPGAQVAKMSDADGWVQIARDGKAIGYVEASGLAPLH